MELRLNAVKKPSLELKWLKVLQGQHNL